MSSYQVQVIKPSSPDSLEGEAIWQTTVDEANPEIQLPDRVELDPDLKDNLFVRVVQLKEGGLKLSVIEDDLVIHSPSGNEYRLKGQAKTVWEILDAGSINVNTGKW